MTKVLPFGARVLAVVSEGVVVTCVSHMRSPTVHLVHVSRPLSGAPQDSGETAHVELHFDV